MNIREYAARQTASRLGRFVFELHRAARTPDPESIHQLRVASRRLLACLRLFEQFYPAGAVKRIRKRVRELMKSAAELRDRDIAIEFLREYAPDAGAGHIKVLASDRAEALGRMHRLLERWDRRGFSLKWRSRLRLSA